MVLMDDILDFVWIEVGVMLIEMGDVNVYDVFLSIIEFVCREVEEKGILFMFSVNEELGELCVDEKCFCQIVFNLFFNVLIFMFVGGIIDVNGDWLFYQIWILVMDIGQGIDLEYQLIVFDCFESCMLIG